MKKPIVFALIVVGLAAGGGYLWTHRDGGVKSTGSQTKSADVYYCPMHPTYTSDRPGDCPICFMKLVKKQDDGDTESAEHTGHEGHAGHGQTPPQGKEFTVQQLMAMKPGEICLLHKCSSGACTMAMTEDFARLGKCPACGDDLGVVVKDLVPAGYAPVKLTAERQQLIGVKTMLVQRERLKKPIRTVGRIAYDPELYQVQEEYLQALQSLKRAMEAQTATEAGTEVSESVRRQAERLLDSSRVKLKVMGVSDKLIAEIEKAGKPDRSLLYSEAGGEVWLYAPIYEYEIPLIKSGETVQVEVPSLPGKIFMGTISSIDTVLDPATRSVRVRARLDNRDGMLKPEMYVNATIQVDLGEVLAVPEEAVFATGEKFIVFVAKDSGVLEPRQVTVGVKSGGKQEIKSGLGPGENVVVSGNFLIDSESRLKAALEGMGGSGGGSGGEHKHGQ